MQWILLIVAVVFLIVVGNEIVQPVDRKWRSFGRYRLPAGPRGSPIVGNMLEFWKRRKNGTLQAWFLDLRSHGEMTTLRMGSTLWVLLNTNRTTSEIISKQAHLTHERPPMPISGSLVSKGMRSVTQPTRIWTELRRLMRPLLTDPWQRTFISWQDSESRHLLRSYLQDPDTWYLHNSRYATGVMYGVFTGERLGKSEEEMGMYRRTTMEFLATIQSTVVDFFPWLEEVVPRALQIWRGKWEAMGERHYGVFKAWWEPMRDGVSLRRKENGSASTSAWVKDVVLEPKTQFKGSEDEAMYLTNTVMSAGGDNPRIALNACLMAGIVHPNLLQTCRDEIDSICGNGPSTPQRLPTVEDVPSLPKTCAFIKETLRWRPVVPMIPPHTASEDFAFEDYIFPKGTNFIINVPATSRDYPEPELFKPERWEDGNEAKLTHGFWGFGGGRRVCIGYKAAQTALFLPFSRLVFCFDFDKRGDFDDRKVNSWSPTEPFPLSLRPRSEAHKQLILKEGDMKGPIP